MDGRGDRGGRVAIIGMACRFPGARDPAEFHDLAVAGRRMFRPAAVLPGRQLRAALLDDWTIPQVPADDPLFGDLEPGPQDLGPVQKLATEMTALALTDAGLREAAGASRADTDLGTLTQAIAALFTAGALTDLTPFLAASRACVSGGPVSREATVSRETLASRPVVGCVPRMRDAEPPAPPASQAGGGAGARTPARSVN